jgi:hypothetical protein
LSFDTKGDRVDGRKVDLSDATEWHDYTIDFTVPANAESSKVGIFLSKTGMLTVKNVSLWKLDVVESHPP